VNIEQVKQRLQKRMKNYVTKEIEKDFFKMKQTKEMREQ